MDMVRKCFGQNTSQGCNNGKGESRGIWRIKRWRLWISQSCFFLGFLSQNSLWKLSTFRGYKGYLYWSEKRMQRVNFSITEWSGDLALQLDWVASSSRELTASTVWDFCPVVQQLAWLFSSPHAPHVCRLWQLANHESSRKSLHPCTILSIFSHFLTHYPYMNPT